METSQICTKCKINKPLSHYLFDKSKSKNKYLKWCKECTAKYKREYYQKNKDLISKKGKAYKDINHDKVAKQKKLHYSKNKKSILKRNKIYRDSNKHKKYLMDKKYREQNKEKLSKKQKEYRENNKEIIAKKQKEYRSKNRKKLDRQKKEYRETEKGKIVKTNSENKRRFLKRQDSDNTIPLGNRHYPSSEVLIKMLKQQDNKCIYCKCEISHKLSNIHLDHIVPLNKGGIHSIHNVQWLCDTCNISKSDKDPIEFANKIGRLL